MTEAATLLLAFLSHVAESAPDALPLVHALVKAFCQCQGIDLGKEPPDGKAFDAVDRKIDEERKARRS